MVGMESFTLRARRVLSIANQEAKKLMVSNIETDYLLLGLAIEEHGVAGRALSNLGVSSDSLREYILQLSISDKQFDPNKINLANDTLEALEFAVDESRHMGHHYIGTEHLLLGLLRFENKAIGILKLFDKTTDQVRYQIKNILIESTSSLEQLAIKNFSRPLRVFLCHSSTDKPYVRRLFSRLKSTEVIDPWLDEERLLPGQEWRAEISQAVRNSDIILVCLSKNSINKVGYVQKEIKIALDVADEHPDNSIFIIPARLEECAVPERLKQWHWVDLFDQKGEDKLFQAFVERANRLGISIK